MFLYTLKHCWSLQNDKVLHIVEHDKINHGKKLLQDMTILCDMLYLWASLQHVNVLRYDNALILQVTAHVAQVHNIASSLHPRHIVSDYVVMESGFQYRPVEHYKV